LPETTNPKMAEKPPTNFAPGDGSHVAELPEWGSCVRPVGVREWRKVPAVSGMECIRVLRRAGFVIFANLGGRAELHRDGVTLEIPLSEALSPDVVVAILHRAGITPNRFLALMDE
jgi:hypothetical protein